MQIVLRIIGAVWILIAFQPVLALARGLLSRGLAVHPGLSDFLNVLMFAGGIGLLLLKEWGRWVLLLGSVAFLLLLAGPSLLRLQFGPVTIKHLVFYGIFIALLMMPQAKSVTQK